MSTYSDFVVAVGIGVATPKEVIDSLVQGVMAREELSLTGKGLYALAAAAPGDAINPFEDLFEPAEKVHRAVEELVAAGLVRRV